MEIDNDDELMYENLADLDDNNPAPPSNERPVSSTGSLPDDSDSDEDDRRKPKPSGGRTIRWSEDDDPRKDREVLVARRSASEFPRSRFGIEAEPEREQVKDEDIQELYDNLNVDVSNPQVRASALYVQTLKPTSVYEIEKIFGDFNPTRCALLTSKTAILKFADAYVAAEALINLTKRLVRIRKESAEEEGELNEDDASDSEDKKQHQVIVVRKDGSRKRKQMSNTIELDIDEVEIPVGCWQVVCKHVPKNVYVFVRLANGIEVRQSMINPYRQEASEDVPEPEKDYEQPTMSGFDKKRVKTGINVFKEDGTELPWNFEHDTRFYEDGDKDKKDEKIEESKLESKTEEFVTNSGQKIISRGRGTKKFLAALESDSD